MADPWPSSSRGVHVTFTLDRPEFFRAMYQSANADPTFWRTAGMSVIGLCLGAFLVTMGMRTVGTVVITINALLMFCVAYSYVALPIQSWKALENNRKQQTYEFSPEGVNEQLANLSGFMKWIVFSKVVETRDFYVFLVQGRRGIFLPKRAFETSTDQKNLRQLVRGQVAHRLKEPSAA